MPTLAEFLTGIKSYGLTPTLSSVANQQSIANLPIMNIKNNDLYGYDLRAPFDSENNYFLQNTNVGGMAAEDGKIILNPYSQLTPTEKMAVAKNEAIRLWMRDRQYNPQFQVTPEQQQSFSGTAYANDPTAMRQTLLARMLTGDPSAGQQTFEQNIHTNRLADLLKNPIFGAIE